MGILIVFPHTSNRKKQVHGEWDGQSCSEYS